MSSKKKSGGGKQAANADLRPSKEVLQGLILADSFDSKFTPITRQAPRALLPLANIPLLEYSIEFLASNGVEEIFVFCCAHAKMIQDYISKSKWTRMANLTVKCVISLSSLSAGDALREMYNNSLINSDFILVSGDLVSNMKLDKVLAAHKARRQKDKNSIMTTVLKKAPPAHRTRSLQDDVVVAIDRPTGKLLYFDNDPLTKELDIDLQIFQDHSEVQLRYDLIDCRIDVCSPEVLYLFADNFDWQDIRQDFLRGILTSEILGNKIYTHVISGEYGARVKCLRTYDAVSRDIIHRWTYPLVPDNNFLIPTTYSYMRNGRYFEKNVKLSRSCTIHEDTVIGEGSDIGTDSHIYQSIIGRNCIIGNNVTIKESYIWDDVTIEDNVVIEKSIVCNGAIIHKNTTIERGCILSFDVAVGPDFTLPTLSKVTTYNPPENSDDFDDMENLMSDGELGEHGYGKLWIAEADRTNTLLAFENTVKETEEEYESDVETKGDGGLLTVEQQNLHEHEKFLKEAREILHSSFTEGHELDNVALEINGLKFAFNATFADCAVIIIKTLLDECKDEKNLLAAVQKILKKWEALLLKYIMSDDDQVELIWGIQDYCEQEGKEKYRPLFPIVLHALYDGNVIEEDAILQWVEESEEANDTTFVKLSEKFLTWLKEAEEDDDDDEDDEEEDDE